MAVFRLNCRGVGPAVPIEAMLDHRRGLPEKEAPRPGSSLRRRHSAPLRLRASERTGARSRDQRAARSIAQLFNGQPQASFRNRSDSARRSPRGCGRRAPRSASAATGPSGPATPARLETFVRWTPRDCPPQPRSPVPARRPSRRPRRSPHREALPRARGQADRPVSHARLDRRGAPADHRRHERRHDAGGRARMYFAFCPITMNWADADRRMAEPARSRDGSRP